MWRLIECHAASLRLHDPLDEVQAQSVTWDIRSHPFPAVKGFEQMPLINSFDARAVIDDAQADLVGVWLALPDNFDLYLVPRLPIFECIAQ